MVALKRLKRVCEDDGQLGRDQVNVAGKILEAAYRFVELDDLNARLARLEELLS